MRENKEHEGIHDMAITILAFTIMALTAVAGVFLYNKTLNAVNQVLGWMD